MNKIGDMKQAEAVCKEYLNKYHTDNDMRIRLGMVYYRSCKEQKINHVLDSFSDLKKFFFANMPSTCPFIPDNV